ncbi:hypothetical protein NM688_g6405 [Phlebia brevispora]|uniref:Uncharacterized protein n=1 Tax=Phlebia brevispora TaxID=194682 RepID=A0ACC1SGL5_9APHY|nr:hypothetical protein NM688_g6405 [Phlebia brevispora]
MANIHLLHSVLPFSASDSVTDAHLSRHRRLDWTLSANSGKSLLHSASPAHSYELTRHPADFTQCLMPRRKPSSSKQKKAQLQQKRAIKRGDISPPPPSSKPDHRHRKGKQAGTDQSVRAAAAADSSRRLQSSFVKLPKDFLDNTRRLAADLPLARPIRSDVAIWKDVVPSQDAETSADRSNTALLACPRRPKWRYDMSKKEVEKNEEGLFKKWLDQTDAVLSEWNESKLAPENGDGEQMPSAPTSFERNLEVWRQLWRVTEISQILLILLDSRCPLLHYPPSLVAYLSSPQFSRKRIILVLTKVDIAGPFRTEAWMRYLKNGYPGTPVVPVESYLEKKTGEGTGQRKAYEPFIPSTFRQNLVNTLRDSHASLLEPPERVKAIPDKLKAWKPPVKKEINWNLVVTAHGGQTGAVVQNPVLPHKDHSQPLAHPSDQCSNDAEEEIDETDPDFLTIGLIGSYILCLR